MPMYEYKCRGCGDVFEVRQKFSDEPLQSHEGCGGAVERLISAPAFQFKGSGWYITDYAKGGKAKPAENGAAKTEGKTEAKSETKSDTKTASDSSSSPAADNKKK